MEKKQALRMYAKKRHGAYPEVDKFILVDLNAKPQQRYLVDGDEFAPNLAQARTKMAERLKLSNPKLVEATETLYTPATGYKQPNHRLLKSNQSDEGSNMTATATEQQQSVDVGQKGQMPLTAPQGQAQLTGTEVPFGNWAKAVERQQEWAKNNPEPNKAEDAKAWHKWVTKNSAMNRAVVLSRGHALGEYKSWNAGTAKAKDAKPTKTTRVSKDKTKETTMKKDTTPVATQQQARPAPVVEQKPMMIETGSIKITVYGAEQMDTAIASLKRNGVI